MTAVADHRSAQLVAALEDAWASIRRHHPELPDVMIIISSGADSRKKYLTLGHFAQHRWTTKTGDEIPAGESVDPSVALHEIMIGGEGLRREGAEVMATLIHEGAHALATVRNVKDTSRGGRYHNKRFKALANEMGLEITQVPVIGWSETRILDETKAKYAEEIAALDDALTVYRRMDAMPATTTAPKKSTNLPPAVCRCDPPRKLRISNKALGAGPVMCGVCGEPFERENEDEDGEET